MNYTTIGIVEMAPSLLGADPTRLSEMNQLMDWVLLGSPHAKSAIDMACWDILGKVANLPVCELLGGRFDHGEGVDAGFQLYRAISQVNTTSSYNVCCSKPDHINPL